MRNIKITYWKDGEAAKTILYSIVLGDLTIEDEYKMDDIIKEKLIGWGYQVRVEQSKDQWEPRLMDRDEKIRMYEDRERLEKMIQDKKDRVLIDFNS